MGFRDREKKRQYALGSDFFEDDPFGGNYRNQPRFFCLSDRRKNLCKPYRESAILYFRNRNITWHDGGTAICKRDLPSNHLCCSQNCCVNFNFPFMNDANGLRSFLRLIGYSVSEVLPIEFDICEDEPFKNYIGFEWIGEENYLGEHVKRNAQRTRGEYFTSADFVIRFRQEDGKIRVVLGEWKYTEYYQINKSLRYSKNKTDRLKIYQQPLEAEHCQIKIDKGDYEHLFYDPFDQLMRLQLLATKMEEHEEMGANIVSTIHIVPKVNNEFVSRITSPRLSQLFDNAKTVHDVWNKLVPNDRFKGLYLEDILPYYGKSYEDEGIQQYVRNRYGNMK